MSLGGSQRVVGGRERKWGRYFFTPKVMIWSCGLLPWLAEWYFWVWLWILQLPQCTGWLILYPCANWGEKLVLSPFSHLATSHTHNLLSQSPKPCLSIQHIYSSLWYGVTSSTPIVLGNQEILLKTLSSAGLAWEISDWTQGSLSLSSTHPSVLEAMQCQGTLTCQA